MGSVAIEWVVFDLGEVVLARTERLADLADLLGVDADRLPEVYAAHRGISTAIRTRPPTGRRWPPTSVSDRRLPSWWNGSTRWTPQAGPSARPDTVDLIEDLHSAGLGLAVCSNASSSMGRAVRGAALGRADPATSCSPAICKVLKPEPAIYDAVLAATGASPQTHRVLRRQAGERRRRKARRLARIQVHRCRRSPPRPREPGRRPARSRCRLGAGPDACAAPVSDVAARAPCSG